MPKISVIIPNYNGRQFLETCLSSLTKQAYTDFETILVDDASTDESLPFVRTYYPNAEIISLTKNVGFASSVNKGIKQAKGQYIALLNNDTETDKDWLAELNLALDTHKDVGFCASLMIDYNNRNMVDCAGIGFSSWGRAYKRDSGQVARKFKQPSFVFGASAGAAMYRRTLFEKVGLFDEDFWAFFEDVDLSFRAQLAGFKCLYVPQAIVYHIGTASHNKKSVKLRYTGYRNKQWVIFKNYPAYYLLKYYFKYGLSEMKTILTDFKEGFFLSPFIANWLICKDLPKLFKKRIEVQRLRTVSLHYLDSIIDKSYYELKRIINNRR
ncbi:MAG: glycosyltransferase family 2 protein [Planctomycetia bacterium]|nr:glycosyltransferase family 2 protein [Candidatus Brocadia sp.]QOJ05079.1 MAG: glycosyltransferase family 2 protein [Planctomycetia bacterium]TVL97989.1 MAG: glycosyltransferase family 2 protein [Candidatus Brocadia sp. BL1]HQU30004.1 glycosyltransferase family 2 protein [Candidatus Brocadia sapporoensis]